MTRRTPTRHTLTQLRQSFDAQRPIDSDAKMPERKKRKKFEEDGLEGIGGTEGENHE